MSKYLDTAVIAFLIISMIFVLFKIMCNCSPTVQNLKASFTSVGGIDYIQVNYTNPSTFGDNNATWYKTLFYLIDCGSSACPADIARPTPDQITSQPIAGAACYVDYATSHPQDVVSSNVQGSIPLANLKTPLVAGHTYKVGISIMNSTSSMYGNAGVPNIYGDFVYTTVVYGDPVGPGKVSALKGSLS